MWRRESNKKNEVREVTGSLIIQDPLKDHYKDFGFYSEKNRFDQRSNMNNLRFNLLRIDYGGQEHEQRN